MSPCPPAKATGRQSSGDKARLERECKSCQTPYPPDEARVALSPRPCPIARASPSHRLASSPRRHPLSPRRQQPPGPLSRPASGAPGRELREQVRPGGWEWCILSREGTPEDRKRRVWGRVVRGKAEYRGESVRWGKCPLELEDGNSGIGVGEMGMGNGQWGNVQLGRGEREMGNGGQDKDNPRIGRKSVEAEPLQDLRIAKWCRLDGL